MSRPKFPIGTILPVNCIHAIRQEQETYDRDPEAYERREREGDEQRRMEEEEIREQERRELERHQEQREEDQLPF